MPTSFRVLRLWFPMKKARKLKIKIRENEVNPNPSRVSDIKLDNREATSILFIDERDLYPNRLASSSCERFNSSRLNLMRSPIVKPFTPFLNPIIIACGRVVNKF